VCEPIWLCRGDAEAKGEFGQHNNLPGFCAVVVGCLFWYSLVAFLLFFFALALLCLVVTLCFVVCVFVLLYCLHCLWGVVFFLCWLVFSVYLFWVLVRVGSGESLAWFVCPVVLPRYKLQKPVAPNPPTTKPTPHHTKTVWVCVCGFGCLLVCGGVFVLWGLWGMGLGCAFDFGVGFLVSMIVFVWS